MLVNFVKSSMLQQLRRFSTKRPTVILGIETSCDDTGCAIVDSERNIRAQCLSSQEAIHLRVGGINPPIAQEFHRQNIERVVRECLVGANMDFADIDAIAVTNRPGLILSLVVGVRYARHLARVHGKPLIPIHHMEAHALMARIDNNNIEFPFLCLLASGGHCLLTICQSVHEFQLLGDHLDDAPGECFDKVARALRLQNVNEYRGVSGGRAIELAAMKAQNSERYPFPVPLSQDRNCQFSFSGLKTSALVQIQKILRTSRVDADTPIEHYEDFCAGFLKAMTKHMLRRTQRALEYCRQTAVFDERPGLRSLVFSGGVACNDFIFTAMSQLANQYGYACHRPAKKLCTDNGVMIAWNGMERWTVESDSYLNVDLDSIQAQPKCPLGVDLIKDVENREIKPTWAKVPIMRTKALTATQ